ADEVGVLPPAEACVEGLRPIDVGHRYDDDFEFHIHPVHVLSSAGDRLRLTVACWIDTEQHRSSAPAAARAAGAPGRQPNEPVSISPAGSYVPMTTPVVDTTLSTSRSLPGIVPPANSRLPEPTTTGNTHSRYRSTRLCRISVCSRSP